MPVQKQHIDALVASLSFQFARIGDTTTTVCEAFLPNGFSVGSGKSACVNPDDYNYEDGCKYAMERAVQDATNKLWELEGYLLAVTGKTSDNLAKPIPVINMKQAESYVVRMKQEHQELAYKLERLSGFIASDTYESLPKEDGWAMVQQYSAMRTYKNILEKRIKRAETEPA
ncbi:Gp49 family protein [Vibrio breoganii]|uniref:Phage protein n=1 Tax=Vibrio breoganii TaxID=553239 RepID=A0AAP8MX84_9VIBR|nr:Gp49 family protein [Vibrio breoganii]PMP10221.1 hypothetical protein BCS93_11135 [Vibrio breoganii]